jgi:putative aldouronate transport system permease protein
MAISGSAVRATMLSVRLRAQLIRFARLVVRDRYLLLMMVLPAMYFIVFCYLPMYGVTLAFKRFDIGKGIMDSPWIGLQNFREFFANPYSYKVIVNTLMLRVWHLTLGFPMPIVIALLLNEIRNNRFKRLVQTSSYLPHFISLVVVCGMVVSFLSSDGILNSIVKALGGQPQPWLQLPQYFRPIWLISGVWQDAGWTSVIYLAALSSISPELYEAALVDGANRWQRIRHITIPGIMPTVTIMFLLRVGQLLALDFQKVLLLYTPSTYETADILGTYIYRRGILMADFSFATAVGLFQALVGLVFIVGANTIAKKAGQSGLW